MTHTTQQTIKVLFIEDDPDQQLLYQSKFELEGMTVVLTKEGKSAVSIAEKEQPDLILLDILMDEVDGMEVLEHLKASKKARSIPVLLFTNLAKKDLAQRGKELGAVDYLIKTNYTPGQMVEIIQKVVSGEWLPGQEEQAALQ